MTKRSDELNTAAAVVLVGIDGEELGATAAVLRERGLRVAVVVGAADADTIVEMVEELYPLKPAGDVR